MADGCGCDALAHDLLSVPEALEKGLAAAAPIGMRESLPLAEAIGRVLAQDCVSQTDMPGFDNAAMDGFALRTADLGSGSRFELPVAGRVAAGDSGVKEAPSGAALRILTGAPVPAGFDAVVMQEHCERLDGRIRFDRRPQPGQHIRRAGEDLRAGETILTKGCLIGPREAGALAAAGYGQVQVNRRLKVAFFSTGNELRHPGEPLGPGQIWNSNRFMLRALLDRPWVELSDIGPVDDDPMRLEKTLREACDNADLIVTTGGVSVGDEDHMPRLFAAMGGKADVMKVAMKPGKPLMFGRRGGALYIGLPGNPVSAYVTWRVIGAHMMARRAGLSYRPEPLLPAVAAADYHRHPGRQEYRPARILDTTPDGRPRLKLLGSSYSGRVALLAQADGVAVLPAQAADIAEGAHLEFLRF